jgi:flagellin-like protein
MKKVKGISPLVAAVLLIAVTMTIAGMLAYWATGFVRTGLPSNVTEVECTGANFKVYDCKYNSTANRIDLLLQNIGGVDLRNLSVFVVYSNNTVSTITLNETLSKAQIKSYQLNGISSDYTKLTITSPCPGVEATTTCGK